MKLDGLMFDSVRFYPFVVTVECVRANAYVFPRVPDDVTMNELVKGKVFEFIGVGGTNNGIVLCEPRRDWF